MRLINTHTLELEEFEGQNIPAYAILSHRWEDQEVLLRDVERGIAVQKKGWQKITKCCELARMDGLSYFWIDTCCIDKSSSAELSEAINSMFRWYQSSRRCYVYLYDVHLINETWQHWETFGLNFNKWDRLSGQGDQIFSCLDMPVLSSDFVVDFCSSVWFTRGWTLQELLASEDIIFFGSRWQILGTKDFLCGVISHRTNIPTSVLTHTRLLDSVPIAERMSWAAKRNTTRIEDRAYSLMGIFRVNMPMLYGEGEVAFTRLQEEILKHSNDQSILLWDSNELAVLAWTPDAFKINLSEPLDLSTCSLYPFRPPSLVEETIYRLIPSDDAFNMTQIGLSIDLFLIPWHLGTYLVPLNLSRVTRSGPKFSCHVAHIFLNQQVGSSLVHRVRFRGKAITYIDEEVSSKLQYNPFIDDFEQNDETLKKRCTIAYNNLRPDTMSQNVESDTYEIRFYFQKNDCWGPGGIPSAENVISRQKWSPTEPRVELQTGFWGPLIVFRVFHLSGEFSYIYAGFDQAFKPSLVQKNWDHPVDFNDAMGAHPDPDAVSRVLDPWIFNMSVQDGTSETQVVLQGLQTDRSTTLTAATMIPGIAMSSTCLGDSYLFDFKKHVSYYDLQKG